MILAKFTSFARSELSRSAIMIFLVLILLQCRHGEMLDHDCGSWDHLVEESEHNLQLDFPKDAQLVGFEPVAQQEPAHQKAGHHCGQKDWEEDCECALLRHKIKAWNSINLIKKEGEAGNAKDEQSYQLSPEHLIIPLLRLVFSSIEICHGKYCNSYDKERNDVLADDKSTLGPSNLSL